jgi:hypothetical protein
MGGSLWRSMGCPGMCRDSLWNRGIFCFRDSPFRSTSNTGVTDISSQLSTIAYLVDVYQAEAAASGKRVSSFPLVLFY